MDPLFIMLTQHWGPELRDQLVLVHVVEDELGCVPSLIIGGRGAEPACFVVKLGATLKEK